MQRLLQLKANEHWRRKRYYQPENELLTRDYAGQIEDSCCRGYEAFYLHSGT